jgi:hypothetical protein
MPTDEKSHPMQVSLLGLQAIVKIADALPNLVKQTGRAKGRRAGFHTRFIPVYITSIKSLSLCFFDVLRRVE